MPSADRLATTRPCPWSWLLAWLGILVAPSAKAFTTEAPTFNPERSWRDLPFELKIECPTPQATIWLTTNGTLPSLTNRLRYSAPLNINSTTVIRAYAEAPGTEPSPVRTHTYLFGPDILRQTNRPAGWPATWGSNRVDYGLDPRITSALPWKKQLPAAFAALPIVALSLALPDLFDPKSGIYANPSQDGRTSERPVGFEMIFPDGNSIFANAGLRIRGGFSRELGNPKHSFRLFFRSNYEMPSLHFPAGVEPFGEFGRTDPPAVREFDRLDLRTTQDGSWAFLGDRFGLWVNDSFARDSLLATGQLAEHGRWCHLFLNGIYWGLYELVERPEAHFAADYLGGSAADYDVLKVNPDLGYRVEATDGDMIAWTALWRAATNGFTANADYFRVQGLSPSGVRDPNIAPLLEVTNLIDYLLVSAWTGNVDGPILHSLTDGKPNNFFAFRARDGRTGGFRFVTHDAELTLGNLREDRTGLSNIGAPERGDGPDRMTPYYLWSQLRRNAVFRDVVVARIRRHFSEGGALSTRACWERFSKRLEELAPALVAESARWGDAHQQDPITPADWQRAVNDRGPEYFPWRSEVVLSQLHAQGLWREPIQPHLSILTNPPVLEVRWLTEVAAKLELSNDGGQSWPTVTNRITDRYGFKFLQVRPTNVVTWFRLRN